MKKLFAVSVIAILSMVLVVPSVLAGRRHQHYHHQHHYYAGDACLGIGIFSLGAIFGHVISQAGPPPQEVHHYYPPPSRRVWVRPMYREVWNPGHYNRHRRWIPGRWIRIIDRPGHWDYY